MTTRTEVLAAARQRIVKDGHCPHCLGYVVEFVTTPVVICLHWMDIPPHPELGEVYSPETGEVVGEIA